MGGADFTGIYKLWAFKLVTLGKYIPSFNRVNVGSHRI